MSNSFGSFLEAVTAIRHFCCFLHFTLLDCTCMVTNTDYAQMDSSVLKFHAVLGPYTIVRSFAQQKIFKACKNQNRLAKIWKHCVIMKVFHGDKDAIQHHTLQNYGEKHVRTKFQKPRTTIMVENKLILFATVLLCI